MSGAHIAVVDDEADLRSAVARYLLRHGFAVSEAESGAALRTLMTERAVDLVVLDVYMPGEDGLSVARCLRARGPVGIIMLTGACVFGRAAVGAAVGGRRGAHWICVSRRLCCTNIRK